MVIEIALLCHQFLDHDISKSSLLRSRFESTRKRYVADSAARIP